MGYRYSADGGSFYFENRGALHLAECCHQQLKLNCLHLLKIKQRALIRRRSLPSRAPSQSPIRCRERLLPCNHEVGPICNQEFPEAHHQPLALSSKGGNTLTTGILTITLLPTTYLLINHGDCLHYAVRAHLVVRTSPEATTSNSVTLPLQPASPHEIFVYSFFGGGGKSQPSGLTAPGLRTELRTRRHLALLLLPLGRSHGRHLTYLPIPRVRAPPSQQVPHRNSPTQALRNPLSGFPSQPLGAGF